MNSSAETCPYDKPPSTGELNIVLPVAPVSLQASRSKRDAITAAIRDVTQVVEFILMGDVKIEIEWFIHERVRYESHAAPDVDNIIKPILDALSGPRGLLVDDCQVQEILCRWIDWAEDAEQTNIRIRFLPDEWSDKEGLIFVHLGKGLCVPLHRGVSPEATLVFLEIYEQMLQMRQQLLGLTGDYYAAQMVMSVQRVFHRSRLSEFEVFEASELRGQAKAAA